MRLTFITIDRVVVVNGESRDIETIPNDVPDGIHAVQVYNAYTEVEYVNLTNDVFSEPPDYVQSLIAAWEENEPVPEPEPDPEVSEEPSETGE